MQVQWQQLRELERDGLLVRVVEARRVSYALTALGEGLQGPLSAIEAWSRDGQVGERMKNRITQDPPEG